MNTFAKFHAFITLQVILAIFNTRHLHYLVLQGKFHPEILTGLLWAWASIRATIKLSVDMMVGMYDSVKRYPVQPYWFHVADAA